MDDTKKYSNKDIIFVIVYCIILFASVIFTFNFFYSGSSIYLNFKHLTKEMFNAIIYTVFFLILFLYIKIRHFPLLDFYISKRNIKKSIVFGLLIGLAIAVLLLTKVILIDKKSINLNNSWQYYIFHFFYLLIFVAGFEEIFFRGFIQTIFLKKINNKVWAIILGGIIFSLVHFVSLALDLNDDTSFINGLLIILPEMISLFCMHILFYLLIRKENNIIPAIIVHLIWNFVLFLFI